MKGAHADIKLNSPAGNILTRVPASMQMLFFVFREISVVKLVSKSTFGLELSSNLGARGCSDEQWTVNSEHQWQDPCYKGPFYGHLVINAKQLDILNKFPKDKVLVNIYK